MSLKTKSNYQENKAFTSYNVDSRKQLEQKGYLLWPQAEVTSPILASGRLCNLGQKSLCLCHTPCPSAQDVGEQFVSWGASGAARMGWSRSIWQKYQYENLRGTKPSPTTVCEILLPHVALATCEIRLNVENRVKDRQADGGKSVVSFFKT